jgi:hypothetical protein
MYHSGLRDDELIRLLSDGDSNIGRRLAATTPTRLPRGTRFANRSEASLEAGSRT